MTLTEKLRLAKYLSLLTDAKPRNVVLWNGKKLPNETIVRAAELTNTPVVYFENGLLPNTTTLDPNGVNHASGIPREKHFYQTLSLDSEKIALSQLVPRKPNKRRKAGQAIVLPKRYIFIAFQVPHDTQIVRHSPWIKSMEQLFNEVVKAGEGVSDDLHFVFKEHPSWHKHFSDLYGAHPRAMFANDNDLTELIDNALGVVTINSTVGLEAIIRGKKVITLGQACYNIEDLVLHASDSSTLTEQLNKLESWRFDEKVRQNFLGFLEQIYCIPASWTQFNDSHVKAVEARLLREDKFSQLMGELA